jgi:hypothetical protein
MRRASPEALSEKIGDEGEEFAMPQFYGIGDRHAAQHSEFELKANSQLLRLGS